jgi:CHASE2 domain-containing sensor protein
MGEVVDWLKWRLRLTPMFLAAFALLYGFWAWNQGRYDLLVAAIAAAVFALCYQDFITRRWVHDRREYYRELGKQQEETKNA